MPCMKSGCIKLRIGYIFTFSNYWLEVSLPNNILQITPQHPNEKTKNKKLIKGMFSNK
jgi:hypothetical protein